MSFLASIGSAIASVASTVFGIGKKVVSGINIGGIIDAVSGIAKNVTGTINSVINSGLGQAFGAVSDVIKTIDGVVTDVQHTVSALINPIQSFVTETQGLVNHINNGLVTPIEELVKGTHTLVSGLESDFHSLISNGISGLGKFVGDLSNTLNSTEAQFARATQQLGIQNTAIAENVLAPAVREAGLPGFEHVGAVLTEQLSQSYESVATFERVKLAPEDVLSKYDKDLATWVDTLNKATGWTGTFGRFMYDLVNLGPFLIASTAPARTAYEQRANTDNPTELLGLGDLVKALYRGILSHSDVQAEAAKHGLDPTRLQTLIENDLWLPSPGEALKFFYRGAIGEPTLEKILEALGFTSEYAASLKATYLTPVGPALWATAQSRITAATGGYLRASILDAPPAEYKATFQQTGLDENQIPFAWADHWNIPKLDWWLTAYYKGLRTFDEVKLAAQAENVPDEVLGDLIQVFGETIQLWMIPDMLAQGIFDEQQARDYLHYIGMDAPSIEPIIRYGFAKTKAAKAVTVADLAKVSTGNAATMFDDGVIDQATYEEILVEHGYSADAAKLTVQLAVVKQQLAARKAAADVIVKSVDTGQLSQADAQAQLFALGYTDTEVATYVGQMEKNYLAKLKTPDLSQIEAFYKAGMIDATTAISLLATIGWASNYAEMFVTLWAPKTTGTPTA